MISICAAGGQGVVAILESAGGPVMSDRYSQIVNAPVVSTVAKQLGLPQPVDLDRYQPGSAGRLPGRGALRRRPRRPAGARR